MVGVLMTDMYNKMNLDRTNLSRTLEDSGTMIIPLIPWGTSGIYYTQQLGVTVDQFFIWTVPCYLCICFALFYGFTGIDHQRYKIKNMIILVTTVNMPNYHSNMIAGHIVMSALILLFLFQYL